MSKFVLSLLLLEVQILKAGNQFECNLKSEQVQRNQEFEGEVLKTGVFGGTLIYKGHIAVLIVVEKFGSEGVLLSVMEIGT